MLYKLDERYRYMRPINGDCPNGILQRLIYFPVCILNQLSGERIYKPKKKFPNIKQVKISNISGTPSRIACDLFWHNLNFDRIRQGLGEKLNFLIWVAEVDVMD